MMMMKMTKEKGERSGGAMRASICGRKPKKELQ